MPYFHYVDVGKRAYPEDTTDKQASLETLPIFMLCSKLFPFKKSLVPLTMASHQFFSSGIHSSTIY